MKINDTGKPPTQASESQKLPRFFTFGKRDKSEHKKKKKPEAIKLEPSDLGIEHEFRQARQRQLSIIPQYATPKRLTVLIATMEYEIEDWNIKVKIGGLGVMSSLMGKNLKHQDLIWVIPW